MSLTINHQLNSIAAGISDSLDLSNNASQILPRGTTANRPAVPSSGMIRYNITFGVVEYFNGSDWATPIVTVGAAASVNNAVVTFNGTSSVIQSSPVLINNAGTMFGIVNAIGTGLQFSTGTFATQLVAPTIGTLDSSQNVATTAYVQTPGRNSQGQKFVSTALPSGGNNGDIWYQV